ncbi:MAG TPA: chemotaxis signal transduction protein CheV [Sedimenticola thiotaurini]|uniref:Chemotaxis signal transduction protein CheV n=1 Tax=Sedimenticola thiotaurini TaxID=1543721 RepID=A0A831W660_9GAMM|nr:chemotaxis signal transduction protein CheV [Sedimenticola thiotaurini]
MTSFIQSVDARTQLAGTNRLEVLLFSLGKDSQTGRNEVFGINVFKVREVMHVPEITHAPDMPDAVEGMVSLRGTMVPVINLQKFCGISVEEPPKILMITEYNKHVQGFLVDSVDMIERLNWDEVKAPPPMLASRLGGLVTAVAELENNRLVMIMDVEKVLAETAGFYDDDTVFEGIQRHRNSDATVLFADDSSVARSQIKKTLEYMGINQISAINGAEAWKILNTIADQCEAFGNTVKDKIQIVLTDVEMPEMDGYVLTRKIKSDSRFDGIPVIMHSSLTADANQALGKGVGADAYVSKFQPIELARTLGELLD